MPALNFMEVILFLRFEIKHGKILKIYGKSFFFDYGFVFADFNLGNYEQLNAKKFSFPGNINERFIKRTFWFGGKSDKLLIFGKSFLPKRKVSHRI
jgi:hypothetical protein